MGTLQTVTVTIKGTDAINLQNIAGGGTAQRVPLDAGLYAVSMTGTIYYSSDNTFPLQQVYLFATYPLTSGESEQWFFTISDSVGITITADGINPIYAFIVDQVTTADNTGSVTITFTPL
jgi:hypothetical protein